MTYYFSYGSNMDEEDFNKWCENHGKDKIFQSIFNNIRPAKLDGYKLSFNYFSTRRKGGAANIIESHTDCVYGLLSEIENGDLDIIRKKEGYPKSYNEINVNVERLSDGIKVNDVKTYKVDENKQEKRDCPPTDKYLCLIIRNAIKYKFPFYYIEYLNQFQTKR